MNCEFVLQCKKVNFVIVMSEKFFKNNFKYPNITDFFTSVIDVNGVKVYENISLITCKLNGVMLKGVVKFNMKKDILEICGYPFLDEAIKNIKVIRILKGIK